MPPELTIFDDARAIPDPAARAAYLDRACGADANLRRRVDGLLAADAAAAGAGFLDPPGEVRTGTFDPDATAPGPPPGLGPLAPGPAAGAVVGGRYKLLEPVGEGGMGAVWVAQQLEPVRRLAAVKLIKAGMDSKQVLARFEAERQALALMDHPNIAKVLDGGLHDGRPFFVMELVKGTPITEFCDKRRLCVRDRLTLFADVCRAVQHAHQKGIIHRDIKPSNVLVALYDDVPVPKVIDFGVAKAAGHPLTEHTLSTGFGSVVGTPEYMAPEQASFNQLDVDTRADVYALGVVLYELLTGTTPVDKQSLGRAALLEVLRVVREDEPPRPSARLSTSATLASIAASRGSEPARLARLVRGELDWVVMKALEKDRARRYDTANALTRDVERYLADEVVEARPASAWYRLRKLARRNRARATAAAALLLALVLGAAGTTVGLVLADAARRDAETARRAAEADRQAADAARALAVAEKERADEQAEIARAVGDFLREDLLMLVTATRQAMRGGGVNPKLSVRDALDRGAAQVGDRFKGRPRVEAEVRLAIGRAYADLQANAQAVTHLRRAVDPLGRDPGPDAPETAGAVTSLGLTLAQLPGRQAEAVPLLVRAEAAVRRRHPDGSPEAVRAAYHVGVARLAAGDPAQARPRLEQSLRDARAVAGADDLLTAAVATDLARAYAGTVRRGEALDLLRDALRVRELRLPADHPDILTAKSELGLALHAEKQLPEAERLLTDAFEGRLRLLGVAHPWTWYSACHLAEVLYDRGEYNRAYEYANRAVDGARRTDGVNSPAERRALAINHRAYMSSPDRARPGAAVPPALAARVRRVEELRANPGQADYNTRLAMIDLAEAYQNAGMPAEAVPLLEVVLHMAEEHDGTFDVRTLAAMHLLGRGYLAAGLVRSAIPRLDEHLARTQEALPNSASVGAATYSLAQAYLAAGRDADALPRFTRAVDMQRRAYGAGSPEFANLLLRVGGDLLRANKFAAAEPVLRELWAVRRKAAPDGWATSDAEAALGEALLGQGKFAEAEARLTSGYWGLTDRGRHIAPARRAEVAGRLAELYAAWGKPAEAAAWRDGRAKHPPEPAPFPRPSAKP